ncbi:hypothetical protein [Pseudomonas sp. NA-150]|uniref:hypothetical protein n=1 Tax=Pseudomonas sp. NA-150 TaxID=3367525 RepID=UPI0037C5A2AC
MRIAAKLDQLERLMRVGEFDLTVKAISQVMDECAAAAMGGGPIKQPKSLLNLMEGADAKDD